MENKYILKNGLIDVIPLRAFLPLCSLVATDGAVTLIKNVAIHLDFSTRYQVDDDVHKIKLPHQKFQISSWKLFLTW